jgi:hypothetical protein
MKTKILVLIGCIAFSLNSSAQIFWPNNSLISPGSGGSSNVLGTSAVSPIKIYTGNFQKAEFTSGYSLGPGLGGTLTGDGLRITPRAVGCGIPSTSGGTLDLWTTCSNGTHIKWDGSGQISGQNNRFEIWGLLNGFWFNTYSPPGTAITGRYIFNQQNTEYGRIGLNHYWKVGENLLNFDPQRRLEVFDGGNVPQLRLSYNNNSTIFTDFYTTSLGDLALLPTSGVNERRVGVNTTAPTNTLEINSTLTSATTNNGNAAAPPFTGSATGKSGLTFSDLASTSIPQVNPGPGVLSVNSAGDVIYVPESLGSITNANNGLSIDPLNPNTVQFGNDVGLTTAQLLNDRQVPFNNFSIYFSDPAVSTTGTNRIQLGIFGSGLGELSKFTSSNISADPFRVGGTFSTFSGIFPAGFPLLPNPYYFGGTTGNYKIGVVAMGVDSVNAGRAVGLSAYASSPNGQGSIGVSGKVRAANSQVNIGVQGRVYGTGINNYGGYFTSQDATGTNYGIFASSPIGYAGYFDGDVHVNGDITASGSISDNMFKTNIDSIQNALDLIRQLKPKTFNYDTTNIYGIKFSAKKQYGLIAQEVETTLPELISLTTKPVDYDSLGNVLHPSVTYRTLNYNAFISILLKGLQEQQLTIDSLNSKDQNNDSLMQEMQEQINQILSNIENCCNSNHSMQQNTPQNNSIGTNVDLKDAQSIVLEQNVPNPFAEQTTISYFLPENVSKAQILFYNAQGKLIQSVELSQKGKGQLNVFASDLTNGIYTYTLIADGKIIETKKMLKQQ